MKKRKITDLTKAWVQDREANHQLVWTVGWTFTFLFLSIFFLQSV
jgi:hypothetical protein